VVVDPATDAGDEGRRGARDLTVPAGAADLHDPLGQGGDALEVERRELAATGVGGQRAPRGGGPGAHQRPGVARGAEAVVLEQAEGHHREGVVQLEDVDVGPAPAGPGQGGVDLAGHRPAEPALPGCDPAAHGVGLPGGPHEHRRVGGPAAPVGAGHDDGAGTVDRSGAVEDP
jgi:hypothetical protein